MNNQIKIKTQYLKRFNTDVCVQRHTFNAFSAQRGAKKNAMKVCKMKLEGLVLNTCVGTQAFTVNLKILLNFANHGYI